MGSTLKLSDEALRREGAAPVALAADETDGEPRIGGPFPARVRGVDARGRRFKTGADLESLSASTFCVRLGERVEPGVRLFVVAQINQAIFVLRGAILNVTSRADGAYGVLARITRYRFVKHPADSN